MSTGLAPQNSRYALKKPAEPMAMTTMSTKANACMPPNADSPINGKQNWHHHDGDGFYNPHYGRSRGSSAQSFAGLLKLFENETQPNGSCGSANTSLMNMAVSGGLQQMINRNMNSAVEYFRRWDEGNDTPVQFTDLPVSFNDVLNGAACIYSACLFLHRPSQT